MKNDLKITCPECGHQFSPEAALESHVRAHLDKEYAEKLATLTKSIEDKVKANTQTEFQEKLNALEKESLQKSQRLLELEKQSLSLKQKEKELREREEHAEMELKKKLFESEEKIRIDAERIAMEKAEIDFHEKEANLKRQQESMQLNFKKEIIEQVEKVREEERLKLAELQMKLDVQTRMAEEMKRKAEQGSVQLQGEVQELAIEEYLQNSFPKDRIEEISKGVRGGDCVHVVNDNFGNECGRILYESKRTKSFNRDWVNKAKEDMRLQQARLAILVTEAMPGDMTRFGILEGVWICSFAEFKSVSFLLRLTMLQIGEVTAAQENKGDKMQLLYDYLTGNEFKQRIDAIREAFEQMNTDLQREKAQALSSFAKREKQIFKVMENTVALYGDVKGIAGGAIQSIPQLDNDGGEVGLLGNVA